MTLFRKQVRDTAVSLLRAAAIAASVGAQKVDTSRDTPVPSGKMPALLVYTRDDKKGIAESGTEPKFRTTVDCAVRIMVEESTKEEAEAALDALCDLVENALLGNVAFTGLFEALDDVTTETGYKSDARKHTAWADIIIKAHATEIFQPVFTTEFSFANIYVDAVNVFDPTGVYPADGVAPDTPIAEPLAPPAPRTTGPDQRIEIGADNSASWGNPPS